MTTLFVTHDLEEAIFLGDRVAVMARQPGRVESIVSVPFGRNRSPEIKRTSEFQALRGDLAGRLEDTNGVPTLDADDGR
jgi:NitT/TauT family transport system ATP-binding protein